MTETCGFCESESRTPIGGWLMSFWAQVQPSAVSEIEGLGGGGGWMWGKKRSPTIANHGKALIDTETLFFLHK